MRSAVKIRLEMDAERQARLDGQSRIANWLYNHLLEQANRLRDTYRMTQSPEAARRLYTERGLRNEIPGLKEQCPFLKTVYASVLKNVGLRLSGAIRAYQDGKQGRRAKAVNWPKFRSWKRRWMSLQYDEPWKGYWLEGRQLTLSFGKDEAGKQLRVTAELVEPLPDWVKAEDVRQLRVIKEGDLYFAVFTVERALPQPKAIERVIALDPNHKNPAYGVDSEGTATDIRNPWFVKELDARIDALKARRGQCQKKSVEVKRPDGSAYWKPSRRWECFNQRLLETYRVRQEQTKQYLFTLANRLFAEYDVVGIGDYTPHGGGITTPLRRVMNNQSLIGRFKDVLEWVAQRSGKQYVEYPERGSTRTCFECDFVVRDGLSPEIRVWQCPNCATIHLRDENAAQHGLERTHDKLQLPCSGRRRAVVLRRAWRFTGLGVDETPGIGDGWEAQAWIPTAKKFNDGHDSPESRSLAIQTASA